MRARAAACAGVVLDPTVVARETTTSGLSEKGKVALASIVPSVDYRCAFASALVSPLFMLISTLFHVISIAIRLAQRGGFGSRAAGAARFQLYKELNATLLSEMWVTRRAAEPLNLIAELTDVLAWVALVPPILCLAEIIGRRRSSSMIVVAAFLAGSFAATISLLSQAGTEAVSAYMSTWPSMHPDHHHDGGFGALQALEINYMAARGRNLWFGAFDWAMLALGMFAASTAAFRPAPGDMEGGCCPASTSSGAAAKCKSCCCHGRLPVAWGVVGIIGALLGALNYLFEVLRFADWFDMMIASALCRALLHAIVLPVWSVWLAILICRAHKAAQSSNGATLGKGLLDTIAFGDPNIPDTMVEAADAIGEQDL